MLIDLHTHSTASDGTDSPAGLVVAAVEAGVQALAITDHDTTAGWARAGEQAEVSGVLLVPGAEVSCRVRGVTVHLLSYLHDPAEPVLSETLAASRDIRLSRARTMAELLGRDFPITWEDVLAQAAQGATVGRPHVADALVAAGVVADRDEAFAGLLADGSPYVVHHGAPHPVVAVQRVRAAGGVPVIAHALAAARGKVVGEDVLEEMVAAGLAGVEVDHRDHTAADREWLRGFARAHDLVTTGSSDYHGTGKQNRLAENSTSPDDLHRLLAQASGTRPFGELGALA
ncbi:PHP domain-containing protein [Quadrisphaera sp. INWT6]|uniref:PHP domain-containing protein n=1 Tax=Quadrisphaera sp. INWT6 TaxID=2596917 RepID=UPI0018922219|nr:PHP domain-containing protein [Quadrisphaera sp. INWT6]MBF5080502.1 PHP domain-containing protein [Quadrisphaera sp. INWT6]